MAATNRREEVLFRWTERDGPDMMMVEPAAPRLRRDQRSPLGQECMGDRGVEPRCGSSAEAAAALLREGALGTLKTSRERFQ